MQYLKAFFQRYCLCEFIRLGSPYHFEVLGLTNCSQDFLYLKIGMMMSTQMVLLCWCCAQRVFKLLSGGQHEAQQSCFLYGHQVVHLLFSFLQQFLPFRILVNGHNFVPLMHRNFKHYFDIFYISQDLPLIEILFVQI